METEKNGSGAIIGIIIVIIIIIIGGVYFITNEKVITDEAVEQSLLDSANLIDVNATSTELNDIDTEINTI